MRKLLLKIGICRECTQCRAVKSNTRQANRQWCIVCGSNAPGWLWARWLVPGPLRRYLIEERTAAYFAGRRGQRV